MLNKFLKIVGSLRPRPIAVALSAAMAATALAPIVTTGILHFSLSHFYHAEPNPNTEDQDLQADWLDITQLLQEAAKGTSSFHVVHLAHPNYPICNLHRL